MHDLKRQQASLQMANDPLANRSENGWNRTSCTCSACVGFCKIGMPILIPSDLYRLAESTDELIIEGVAISLLAVVMSPRVKLSADGLLDPNASEQQLPVITMKHRWPPSQPCKMLSRGRCVVHERAPFACAFLDAHQGEAEVTSKVEFMFQTIFDDWANNGIYLRTMKRLIGWKGGNAARALFHLSRSGQIKYRADSDSAFSTL